METKQVIGRYDERRAIGRTIISQIGKPLLYMLGGKDYLALENGVQFGIRTLSGINKVVIKLTPADDYTVEFWKVIATKECYPVKVLNGIYCDQLQDVILDATGLELPTLSR